ncbi:MAG: SCO1664 family protein [Anaerolineales bacterium]|nr:SCO1664 family protein [Anaerolineales bacterium]
MTLKGEFLWGSNYTFLIEATSQGISLAGVYKPVRGERPLWDFPSASLAHREVAAFIVSQAAGWNFVPATVYRRKAPLGPGSVQLYVDHDSDYHYFNFTQEDVQRLRPVVLFDLLINNADRKGSHVMIGPDQRIWLIDHGVCFHAEDKLRTVIWDFVGQPIPDELCAHLAALLEKMQPIKPEPSPLAKALLEHLSQAELRAMIRRGEKLLAAGQFPSPDPARRPYPWPQI